MQMEESERATLQSTLNARPINTKKKYEGYQKEFVEWCNEKVFLDGATVTKSKLHLFLTEEEDAEQDCWGVYRVWLR
ncbi:hypothetical protein PC128_g17792 [Phytophthora cactorum]|nr:hypothetical protein PC128_g17792 [Phytophthora cactorum]